MLLYTISTLISIRCFVLGICYKIYVVMLRLYVFMYKNYFMNYFCVMLWSYTIVRTSRWESFFLLYLLDTSTHTQCKLVIFMWKIKRYTFSMVCFASTLLSTLTQRPLANGGPSDLLRRVGVPLRSPDCKKLKWIHGENGDAKKLYNLNCRLSVVETKGIREAWTEWEIKALFLLN